MDMFDGKQFWINLHDIILFAVYTSVFLTVVMTPIILVALILYRIFLLA
tara:strand:- start:4256 stop:4402 length:147 start_codon:yes stop_codon:yes gene_type:complete